MSRKSESGWFKPVLVFALVLVAAVWGFQHGLPEFGSRVEKDEEELTQLTAKSFAAATASETVLVVANIDKPGSEESRTLEEFLEELEKRDVYSDKVLFAEVSGEVDPELAERMGADLGDPRGHLAFYAGGTKLGELVGETDPKVIEAEIERYLNGLIKRIGPDWLPEVEGMQRVSTRSPALNPESQTP